MRRLLFPAACVIALAAATVLALLADAVFATERSLARNDAQALAAAADEGEPSLRFRIAESMLGAGGDRELQETLGLYRTRESGLSGPEALAQNAVIEAKLAVLAAGGDPDIRSAAANLNGVLLVEDAQADRRSSLRFLQLALERFRAAVTLDPENEEAKANLELLVALLERRTSGLGREGGSQGSTGAGSSPEGSGY